MGFSRAFSWSNEFSAAGGFERGFEQQMQSDFEKKRKRKARQRGVCLPELTFGPFMLFTVRIACYAVDYSI